MKITINSKDLLKACAQPASVIKSGGVIPILSNLLFETRGGALSIIGSDLQTSLETTVEPLQIDQGESSTVPAALLIKLLKSLPKEDITLTFDSSKNTLKVKASTGTYDLATYSAADFPKAKTFEVTGTFSIKGFMLAQVLSNTTLAASQDELRPAMAGVLFDIKTDGTTFVATDGHRLCRYKVNQGGEDAQVILPVEPLAVLKDLKDEDVDVVYDETNLKASFGNTVLITRLIDGKYPNYDAVIPKETTKSFKIQQKTLLNTLKRVSLFSNEKSKQLVFEVDDGVLYISTADLDFSTSAKEKLELEELPNCVAKIGFNAGYLIEMVNNAGDDLIKFSFTEPNRPVLIHASKKPGLTQLVMPVMISE